MNRKWVGNLMLLLTAFIWGSAFVAQSTGMDYLRPFTFNGVRSLIGGVVLLPVLLLWRPSGGRSPQVLRQTWRGGLCCGVILFAASSFQQFGIAQTTVGKASFITALYIVLVPLAGLLFRKRPAPQIWVAVALGALGLYLLCITEAMSISAGDALVLVCSFLFAAHILVIDYFSPRADGVMMSCIQFFVAGVLGVLCALLFESPQWQDILNCWQPLLYAGAMSCGVAYTLQILGQKNTDPAVASLILSLESVFGALCGWLLLGESFSGREFAGVVLMFAAILLAQLPAQWLEALWGKLARKRR